MKINFTLHQSLYFALGIVIMKSVSMIMLPIVTRYLPPAAFGELELLLSISNFATLLMGFGLVEALYRFAGLGISDEKEIGRTVFTMASVSGSVVLLLSLLLIPLLQPYLDNISLFDLQLVIILFSVEGCIAIPLAWLKMKEDAFSFFLLTTGKALLQALLTWILLREGYGITSVLLAGVTSSLLLVILLLRIQIKATGLGLNWLLVPQILRYGLPLTISALAAFAILGADRWVINLVSSTEQLGLYAVGKKLATISVMLMQPFILWWYPRRFKMLKEDNGRDTVAHTTSFGIALVICCSTMICLGSPLLFGTLIAQSYAQAMQYVPALALLYMIKQTAELANLGSYIGRSTWNVTLIDVFTALISVSCFYFLSERFKVPGVIAALLIAQCFRVTLFFITSQRALYLNYQKASLFGLLLLASVLVFISMQLSEFIHHLLIVLISPALLVSYLHLSKLFTFTLFKKNRQVVRESHQATS
ncbi:MAG: lipopolysaccharide biosynthesis protein [Psychromonas sp.]|nr:lipopolysaccharide biosynthesis protein [Psychromonas sp.]